MTVKDLTDTLSDRTQFSIVRRAIGKIHHADELASFDNDSFHECDFVVFSGSKSDFESVGYTSFEGRISSAFKDKMMKNRSLVRSFIVEKLEPYADGMFTIVVNDPEKRLFNLTNFCSLITKRN